MFGPQSANETLGAQGVSSPKTGKKHKALCSHRAKRIIYRQHGKTSVVTCLVHSFIFVLCSCQSPASQHPISRVKIQSWVSAPAQTQIFFTMRSSTLLCHLLLAIFPTIPCAKNQLFGNLLHALLYNPSMDDTNSRMHATTGKQSTSTIMPHPNVTPPTYAVACTPALGNFTLTSAVISACPLCAQTGNGTSTNQSSQTMRYSQQSALEHFNVTFVNPDSGAREINCRLTWDTSTASLDKSPVAEQMDCDKDTHNQLNAVLEKRTSRVAAGFYLFVWNKRVAAFCCVHFNVRVTDSCADLCYPVA